MAILASEIIVKKSVVVSNDSTNGGLMDNNATVISGGVQNVFPHAFKAERTAGSTTYRKLFLKNNNNSDKTLYNPQLWFDFPTEADDWVSFFIGTQTDLQQAGWPGTDTNRKYGIGTLTTGVTGGATSTLIVSVPDALSLTTEIIFVAGDTLRITNMATPDAVTGDEELVVIDAGGVSVGAASGGYTPITLTLTATVVNSYAAYNPTLKTGGRVMTVYEGADLVSSVDTYTDASGIYDESTYPVIADNVGTIEQTVTLTFSDATNFTATSNVAGVTLGSGTIGADFKPVNPDGEYYFNLEAAGWGSPAGADVFSFKTHPAAIPFWEKRVIPASSGSLANNKIVQVTSAETA